jgi:chromate transporter
LRAALAGITAAVVGIILNLTVWFALHVLFKRVSETTAGPLHLTVPDVTTLDPIVALLAIVAAAMLFLLHRGVIETLALCAALSLGIAFAGA